MNEAIDNDEQKRLRKIKSFVLRQGRLTPGQEKAFATVWPQFGISYQAQPLDFSQVFANSNPVVLEIGFGNGDSLAQMAAMNPDNNYLGIEVHRPGVGHLLIEIARLKLTNLRIISHDAIEVIRDCIAAHSLHGVQLFFPDPWHKKRHHKRRIVNPDFLDSLQRILKPGGFFHAATDWANYAEHIDDALKMHPAFSRIDNAAFIAARPQTKFEQRGERLGHEVADIVYQVL